MDSLLIVSEAIARAGLERRESRGAHFREDCPAKSDEMSRFNLVVQQGGDGEMTIRREPLREMTGDHRAIIKEMQ